MIKQQFSAKDAHPRLLAVHMLNQPRQSIGFHDRIIVQQPNIVGPITKLGKPDADVIASTVTAVGFGPD